MGMTTYRSEVLLQSTREEKQKANKPPPILLKNQCYVIKQGYIAGCKRNPLTHWKKKSC